MAFRLLILYLALFLLRPGERYPALESLHLERIVGIIALIACFQGRQKPQDAKPGEAAPMDPVTRDLLLFLGAIILSIPTSVWIPNSIDWMIDYLKRVALFIMIRMSVDTDRKLRIFLWTWLLLTTWNAVEPLLGSAGGRYLIYDSTFGGFQRLRGSTEAGSDPNSLAALVVSTLPFIYFLLQSESHWAARLLLLSLGGLSLATLGLTGSRTGVVGFAALLLVLLLKSRRRVLGGLLIAAVLAGTWPLLDETMRQRYASIFYVLDEEARDSSASAREQIMEDAWAIFLDRPITGVGIGGFATARGERFNRWFWPHNLYLQALAELGIIGTACFVKLLVTIFGMTRKSQMKTASPGDSTNRLHIALAKAIQTSLIVRLVLGLFGHSLYGYYWLLLGALAVTTREITDGEPVAQTDQVKAETGVSLPPRMESAG